MWCRLFIFSFHFIHSFDCFYFIALPVFICLVFYLWPFYSLFQLFKVFLNLSKFWFIIMCMCECRQTVDTCVCFPVWTESASTKRDASALFQSLKFVSLKEKPQSGSSWSHPTLPVSSIPACFQRVVAHIWIIWGREGEKTQAPLCWPRSSALRGLSGGLCLTETINELNHHKQWFGCVDSSKPKLNK